MDIYEVTADFQDKLLERERKATLQMGRSYMLILEDIQRRLTELLDQLGQEDLGTPAQRQQWLYKTGRLQRLREQVAQRLSRFGDYAEAVIAQSQFEATTLAQEAFIEQLVAAADFRIDLASLPDVAIEKIVGQLYDGSPLTQVLQALGQEAAGKMAEALISSVATGINPNQLASSVRKIAGGNLAKLVTIARTETLRAYRESSLQMYQAHASILQGWRWLSSLQLRTCPVCWAMHGTIHPLTERFASHPNCRCAMVPIVTGFPGDPQPTGEQVFNSLDENAKRRILGDSKYDLYKTGRLTLADLVRVGHSDKWGPFRSEQPLSRVL